MNFNYSKLITIVSITLLIYCTNLFAQTDTSKHSAWKPSGVAGFNVNQMALTNWSQGGESSIVWSIIGNFGLKYQADSIVFDNRLKATFGMSKQGTNNFINNDNEFYLEDVLAYKFGWAVDPFFSNSVKTVLANGYDYKDSLHKQISAFFDPAYITQSLGFSYGNASKFATRLGIALQEIITQKFHNYSDDPKTSKIETFKLETGIESVSDLTMKLDENLLYSTKLRLFTRFKNLDVWDVRWDNMITAKINKYLNVNLNILVVHQIDQTLKTQVKEALQIGLTYNLF
ncbi:MAG: DUF3078 domain-containing protein [Candidatus Kapabacteria bacterium]|nr:DUF3078 domain-containing protein [Candidatus Kapabacteria bacterium]